MFELSPSEVEGFKERGFIGPFTHPLLTDPEGLRKRALTAIHETIPKLAYPGFPVEVVLPQRLDAGMPWFKLIHLLVPELWEIAEHPAILDRVRSLLGPDVMWWGTAITRKGPGDVHVWHYDAEYDLHDDGLLLFLGLDGLDPGSALKAITHTQGHRKPPSAFAGEDVPGPDGGGVLANDDDVLAIAQRLDGRAELIQPQMFTGDFFIAHGHTWHGSRNVSPQMRTAVVMSFGPPTSEVRIPTSFGAIPTWYSKLPPCAMLCGEPRATTKNPIAPRPAARV